MRKQANIKNKVKKYADFLPDYICAEDPTVAYQMSIFDMSAAIAQLAIDREFKKDDKTITFIDLFAGIGGIRKGLEQAAEKMGYSPKCVFTSEIKPHAIKVLHQNHPNEFIHGDITNIPSAIIPDFDILCAGFPCQAFSYAGKRLGFADTRGTLFFEVERILKDKNPDGFILENVEGLVNHDSGKTLKTIIEHLKSLDYFVEYRVLNALHFGIPQDRKRIYILGSKSKLPNLDNFGTTKAIVNDILESGKPTSKSKFVASLLSRYNLNDLIGKSIKDKRGGNDNIHSWDLETKGAVTERERELLNAMLKERRKKKWAERYGIDWMDGMPLTEQFIREFFVDDNLHQMLENLTKKGYLVFEHPKKLVKKPIPHREQDTSLPKGYNIVAGKLSFEVSKILNPVSYAPTLVAMDMQRIFVPDGEGIRKLTIREGLRLFGYPEDFRMELREKDAFDLLGNTVVVPVIQSVAERLLETITSK